MVCKALRALGSAFLFSLISSTPHVGGNTPTLQNNSCPSPDFGTCCLLCLKHLFFFFLFHHLANSFPHPSNLIPYNLSFWKPAWVEGLLWAPTTLGCFFTELVPQTSIYLVTFQTPTLDWELLKDRNHVFFCPCMASYIWVLNNCVLNDCLKQLCTLCYSKPMFLGLSYHPGKKQ